MDREPRGRQAPELKIVRPASHDGVRSIGIREVQAHMVDNPISIMPFAMVEAQGELAVLVDLDSWVDEHGVGRECLEFRGSTSKESRYHDCVG
jgi:hypothetical protein